MTPNQPLRPSWLPFLDVMGLYVSGDLDGWTIYTTRRGHVVVFPKSPPTKPPSYLQLQQRQRFRFAQAQWKRLNGAQRAIWELAVQRLGVDMTGQNAVISLSLNPDLDTFNRLNTKVANQLTAPLATPR